MCLEVKYKLSSEKMKKFIIATFHFENANYITEHIIEWLLHKFQVKIIVFFFTV